MDKIPAEPEIKLTAGFDRDLIWKEGASVRYVVADLIAHHGEVAINAPPPLNFALAIDVSGSMEGEKLAAAKKTAEKVTEALGPQDRLTIVAFSAKAQLLLSAATMDSAGKRKAQTAVRQLKSSGDTNLSDGWLLAAEQLAVAMQLNTETSHRLVLLSDGHANRGITDAAELAVHAGELLRRGIITSTVGIGDGYDEALLGGMAEAGGGRLHDAEHAEEISEVVLGELQEGRAAALERVQLRIIVPANARAEVVGPWAKTVIPGEISVLVGTLVYERPRRVVIRIHCPSGHPGDILLFGLSAGGVLPDGSREIEAASVETELRFAASRDNDTQPRDLDRSLVALQAWHAIVLQDAVAMNRRGDRLGVKHFIERELRLMERYAPGVPGAETLLTELTFLLRRAEDDWGERTRKEVYKTSNLRARYEEDFRAAPRETLVDRLRRENK
jgi:Ca-activated chloride channel family protein